MDPVTAPVWMHNPEELRSERREATRTLAGAAFLSVLPTLGYFGISNALFDVDRPGWAILLGLMGFASLAFSPLWILLGACERLDVRRRHRIEDELEARGEPILGGDSVGVAYTDGVWRHDVLGENMDRGVMRIDFDRLTFVGRHTRFDLPASAIVRTEIRRAAGHPTFATFRLFVTWLDSGQTKVLSVDLLYRRSFRRRVAAVTELQERIDAWRGERRSTFGKESPFLLPPSSFRLSPSASGRVGPWARWLGATATLTLAIILGIGLSFLFRGLSPAFGPLIAALVGASVGSWPLFSQAFEKRLPERYRYQAPPSVTPKVELDPARLEDEATVRQQA